MRIKKAGIRNNRRDILQNAILSLNGNQPKEGCVSKHEKGFQRIRQLIKERIRKEKEARRLEEVAARKKEEDRKKAAKIYEVWLENHRSQARAAARIVWDWYEEFISTQIFRELSGTLKARHKDKIWISKILTCSVPLKDNLRDWPEKQILNIDPSGKLFVHDCFKYGKTYLINQKGDLLKYVAWPILIAVAKTITDETVWDILDILDIDIS